jgi:HEPN domain-containing protein
MKKLTAEWVRKAEADFIAANKLGQKRITLHDQVCFHCEQAAEKYLKALMEELNLTIPRTHNLVAILPLLTPHHRSLRSMRRGLDFLTRFAVEFRYPGENASKRQARAALRWANRVRTAARALLAVRPSLPRRKKSP